ncbi:unnamed protein product [Urochloa humidicola]
MACALGAARYDLLRRRAAARPTQRSERQRGDASWPSLSRRQATVRAKHDSVLWTGARSERRTRAPCAPSRRRVLRLDPPALPHLQHPSQGTGSRAPASPTGHARDAQPGEEDRPSSSVSVLGNNMLLVYSAHFSQIKMQFIQMQFQFLA